MKWSSNEDQGLFDTPMLLLLIVLLAVFGFILTFPLETQPSDSYTHIETCIALICN